MLYHAFRLVDRVVFLIGPQNLRSQRAVEKIGAVRVGSRSDASGRESLVYQITATAYGNSEGERFVIGNSRPAGVGPPGA